MAFHGFGPMPGAQTYDAHGLPVIDPHNPMNMYYMNQAEQHARRNPNDHSAQLLWRHWVTTMHQIEAARRALAAGAPGSPLTAPVPSHIPGVEVPTPPGTTSAVSPGFGASHSGTQDSTRIHYGSGATVQVFTYYAICKHSTVETEVDDSTAQAWRKPIASKDWTYIETCRFSSRTPAFPIRQRPRVHEQLGHGDACPFDRDQHQQPHRGVDKARSHLTTCR